MINGELHKLEAVGNKQTNDPENSRSYTTQFTTQGYDSSKSGERKEILIILEVSGIFIFTNTVYIINADWIMLYILNVFFYLDCYFF